ERRGREPEFVGAQDRPDHHIAAGFDLSVNLDRDPAAQAVENQRLLRFRQAQLPGRARVPDRRAGRGTRAAVVPRDGDVVGLGFGHARSHGAHSHFRDELHRDGRGGIRVLQVVDQLRQVLDRVDVVVWRRRDQLHAGSRVADLGDVVGDLAPGQLPAFAGLRALGDLDLDLLRARKIFGRHAEAPRGDLLDLGLEHVAFAQFDVARDAVRSEARAQRLAGFHRRVTLAVLAALAGVRLPADAVHRHRERGVRFDRDRTVRHGAGRKTLDYLGCGFDLVDRNGLHAIEAKFEQTAEGHVTPGLVVDDRRAFLVCLGRILPRRVLQLRDRVGCPHMLFAAHAPRVLPPRIQHRLQHRIGVIERGPVYADRFFGDFEHAYALDR